MHEAFVTSKLMELARLCRQHGLPVTAQRRQVLSALAGCSQHPTAEQLYRRVVASLPGISRTTVYRVLETLVRLGTVRRVDHGGSSARFDAVTAPHHHLHCRQCGRLTDLHLPELHPAELPSELHGFRVEHASLTMTGLCADCHDHH